VSEWIALIISYLFVFATIGAAAWLKRRGRLSPAGARAFVHIGVAHWWLIAMATMRNPWIASIGPLSFILLNAVSLRTGVLAAMEAERRDPGTVLFPVSLLLLVNLCWRGLIPLYAGGVGTLVMGWGDGMASVAGRRWGRGELRLLWAHKSLAGSLAMFLASWVVVAAFTAAFQPVRPLVQSLFLVPAATAALAAIVELLSPLGTDNLTVPILVTAFYWGAFGR
jgi:phytol kinase